MKRSLASIVACAVVALLVGTPVFAQGKKQGNGNSKSSNAGGEGQRQWRRHATQRSSLCRANRHRRRSRATTPFAWIDNASLVAPGAVWIGISTVRWQNAGLSEVNFPVIDAAVGMTPRLQIGASVPRIVANDAFSRPAGFGTTFLNAKLAIFKDSERPFKAAVAPTLEILSDAAMQFVPLGAESCAVRTAIQRRVRSWRLTRLRFQRLFLSRCVVRRRGCGYADWIARRRRRFIQPIVDAVDSG